jgi:flagellar hook assembly protein FlgD
MVKKKSNLQMNIYNILGQKVLSKKQTFSPGINSFTWSAQNSQGAKLSSGIYFIVLRKNTQKLKVKKVTYFK